MNEIIKNIESAQLKAEVPQFRSSRVQYLRDRVEAQERLSQ